jgi:transmembrane sensor
MTTLASRLLPFWFGASERRAAEWVVRRHSGQMTEGDQATLAAWLARRPHHRSAYEKAWAVWALAQGLDQSAEARIYLAQPPNSRSERSPRRLASAVGLGVGLAAATVALVVTLPQRDWHTTNPGEIHSLALEDGSTVWLNGDSRLRVDLSGPERRVWLDRGEAFFKVAHDASHPFVVEAAAKRIVVTGTEFDVRRAGAEVDVSVTEGHVKVEPVAFEAEPAAQTTALSAGEDARFAPGDMPPAVVQGEMAGHKGAWHEGKLYLYGELGAAIDEVNRYTPTKLVLDDERLAHKTIDGVFETGNTDSVVFALHRLFHIEAKREPGKITIYDPDK